MENIVEVSDTKSFIDHMTRFDENTKSNIMNILQYALLCVVPIIIFKKAVTPLFPPVEETKGSLEISVEVALQIASVFIGLFLIHRLVTFVEPYSGKNYPEMNLIHIALCLLFIVMTFETQIAEKVDILVERLYVLWNGEASYEEPERKQNVSVTQPIAVAQHAPSHQNSRADYITSHDMMNAPQQDVQNMTTSIDSLPVGNAQNNQPPSIPQIQQQPNFDQMYTEPMAANEGFGGFSAW